MGSAVAVEGARHIVMIIQGTILLVGGYLVYAAAEHSSKRVRFCVLGHALEFF